MNARFRNSPAQLLDDPDRLIAAWEALKAEHDHLHAPTAAAMLGIPEAALVAAQCGDCATRLKADPRRVLAEIAALGKLLMAVLHHAGVLIGIAHPLEVTACGQMQDWLQLGDARHRLRLDPSAVASMYVLIEEAGAHGRQRHLQAFDAAGHRLFTVLVLYKSHAQGLARLAERHADGDQSRLWTPDSTSVHKPVRAEAQIPGATEALIAWLQDTQVRGETLQVTASRPQAELSVLCAPRAFRGFETGHLHIDHPDVKMHSMLARLGQIELSPDVASAADPSTGRRLQFHRSDAQELLP